MYCPKFYAVPPYCNQDQRPLSSTGISRDVTNTIILNKVILYCVLSSEFYIQHNNTITQVSRREGLNLNLTIPPNYPT